MIIGPPRAGKTTLALELGRATGLPVLHTDDLIDLGWSEASEAVARSLTTTPNLIVEGVAVVRALRKVLATMPAGYVPVERCIALEWPRERLTSGQRAMAAGCATMWREVEPELVRRGVLVERPT